MRRNIYRVLTALTTILMLSRASAQEAISLAGQWRFAIDSNDVGIQEKWFTKALSDTVRLPGSMLENNKGDNVTLFTKWTASIYDSSWYFSPRLAKYRNPGNLMFPFWLTPALHYAGVAWYQKEVNIPASWTGKHINLFLERCHTQTTVWIDNKLTGVENSLVAPHEYDLSQVLTTGKHMLTIRVDNRLKTIDVGQDSHSVTDQTQGNWNGIIGRMELQATPANYVENIQLYPDVSQNLVTVKMVLNSNKASIKNITLSAQSFNTSVYQTIQALSISKPRLNDDTLVIRYPMGEHPLLWSEFHPALYKLHITIGWKNGDMQKKEATFGMRSFTAQGKQFDINGHATFLRGTVENCVFPLTGYPPMQEKDWERIFRIAKSYGLNHMRFHSYCPPDAAFAAADIVGFYLQPEGPSWANHGISLGDGKPIDQYIFDETDRMEVYYGNHPSYCMLAYGNEPKGRHQVEYLTRFIHYWENKDSRRVYTGASVAMSWPLVPDNQYMVKSGARGLAWNHQPESNSDYSKTIEAFHVPYVAHELGQWCAFPDFKEISQYTGLYKAKNFEMFQDILNNQGMGDEAENFLMASGKLQVLCYKHEIEKSLRTAMNGGFQMLSLTDYPGQGTALVGVLNAFWKEKGYVDAKAFSRFCNSTVPLLRTGSFVYTNQQIFKAEITICHYGEEDLKNATIYWRIKNTDGKVLQEGDFNKDIVAGQNTVAGNIHFDLSSVRQAQQLKIEAGIQGTDYVNDWNIWVFPATLPSIDTSKIYYTTKLDKKTEDVLNAGGNVFLNIAGEVVKGKEIVQTFLPVFWNTSWFKMRPPHTVGFVLNPHDAAFANFPTSYHSDLQWWQLINHAQVMHLEDFPADFRPLVQPIDTWFLNRRLASVFEARIGKGKIVVSSLNIPSDTTVVNPAGRQLLYSLEKYMLSDKFNPEFRIDISLVKELLNDPSKYTFSPFSNQSPDELKPKSAITK